MEEQVTLSHGVGLFSVRWRNWADREVWSLHPRGCSGMLEPWGLLAGPEDHWGVGKAGRNTAGADCGRHRERSGRGPRGAPRLHRMCAAGDFLRWHQRGMGTEAGWRERPREALEWEDFVWNW